MTIGFLTWSTVDDQSPHGWIRPQKMIKEWRRAEFSRRQIESTATIKIAAASNNSSN